MRLIVQIKYPAFAALLLTSIMGLQTGCTEKSHGSPQGYDMRMHQKRELGKVLNEISGLSFNSDSGTLLAISDSKRKIYSINLKTQKLSDYAEKFWEQADFEDLVKLKDTVYVLISDGTILAVPARAKDSTGTRAYPFWSEDENDFETLYYDASANGLIMMCKSCAVEKGQKMRTAYRFNLQTKQFDSSAFYTISTDSVKAALKNNDVSFKPSAAAIHPIDKRLYILSSAGQIMVITDLKGNVLEAFNLNPDRNPQAEGLSIAPNGTMFISNEGKYGKATLHVYPYKGKSSTAAPNK